MRGTPSESFTSSMTRVTTLSSGTLPMAIDPQSKRILRYPSSLGTSSKKQSPNPTSYILMRTFGDESARGARRVGLRAELDLIAERGVGIRSGPCASPQCPYAVACGSGGRPRSRMRPAISSVAKRNVLELPIQPFLGLAGLLRREQRRGQRLGD